MISPVVFNRDVEINFSSFIIIPPPCRFGRIDQGAEVDRQLTIRLTILSLYFDIHCDTWEKEAS